MKNTYRFTPQEDLSALDLAEVLEIPEIAQDVFDRMPARIKRHFEPVQNYAVPVIELPADAVHISHEKLTGFPVESVSPVKKQPGKKRK